MSDTPVPAFGLAHVVPEDAIAAWGARFIVTQDGTVDLPWDRQGGDGGSHTRELLNLLDKRFHATVLIDTLVALLRGYEMQTREAEDFTLYLDDRIVVHANTNASAGYCYVTAWLYPEKEEEPAPAMDGNEFMEKHGEQVLTALRGTRDMWFEVNQESPSDLAAEQVRSWQGILDTAEKVVEGA